MTQKRKPPEPSRERSGGRGDTKRPKSAVAENESKGLTFGAVAQRLAANGYQPLPVVAGQKNPVLRDWPQYRFTPGDEGRADWKACSVGILTGALIGVDIDVRVPAVAAEVEALAVELFGPAPRRIGAEPKVLLLYRAAAPFTKQQTPEYRLPGDAPEAKGHRVEILGQGQQFVAYGIHPTTQQPYRWNGAGEPLTMAVDDLPLLDEADVERFLNAAETALIKAGGTPGGKLRTADAGRVHKPNEALAASNPQRCREAIAAIPNDDVAYDDWVLVAFAIKGALSEAGRDAFMEWSRKSTKHTDATAKKTWDSANPTRIGAGAIFHWAREAGFGEPKVYAMADLADLPEFHMEWQIKGWLPAAEGVVFGGHGGSGKSLIAAMLAVCTAAGASFYGLDARQGPVLIYSCEDKITEWQFRLGCAARYLGIEDCSPLPITIVDMRDFDGEPALFAPPAAGAYGAPDITRRGYWLADRVNELRPKLVVLDSATDCFCGDENKRRDVRGYLRRIQRLLGTEACVVHILHIDKAASRNKAKTDLYSGATDWNNGVQGTPRPLPPEPRRRRRGRR